MANVGQRETGDPHGVEGIFAPPEEDDDPEVTLVGVGLPSNDNEGDEDAPLTMKMAVGICIDQGDLRYSAPFGTSQT